MGQKVNPNGLRLGINKDWDSKWYANSKDFSKYLNNDVKIREYFEKDGIYECVNNDYKKLDSYVVSAVNVYGVYGEYMQLKGLLDRE